jgi:hypothetical protein
MDDEKDLLRLDEGDEGGANDAPTKVGASPPAAVLNAMKEAAATGRPLKPLELPKSKAPEPQPIEDDKVLESVPEAARAPSVIPPAPSEERWPRSTLLLVALATISAIAAVASLLVRR